MFLYVKFKFSWASFISIIKSGNSTAENLRHQCPETVDSVLE